jgi:hypothetical protein
MQRRSQFPRIAPLALLCTLALAQAAGNLSVVADPIPLLQIGNAAFTAAGTPISNPLAASDAVMVEFELGVGEALAITFRDLPAAIGTLRVRFDDHQLCGVLVGFIEFDVQSFSEGGLAGEGGSRFPECGTTLAAPNALVIACSNENVDGSPDCGDPLLTFHYRPLPEAGHIRGSLQATYELTVDVTAGPAFGPTPLLVSYAVVMLP